MSQDNELEIRRLRPRDAPAISACFQRVYGDSYANELFYQVPRLEQQITAGQIFCVGAVTADGRVVGHMAMLHHKGAEVAELGNTVVDPAARGAGVAWLVGEELTAWCRQRGCTAYLHYPTTDHHIMQRQSVKAGFETGLMFGYIPSSTDGQVSANKPALRSAATIVFNPLSEGLASQIYVPDCYATLLERLVGQTGLDRSVAVAPADVVDAKGVFNVTSFAKRGLSRLQFDRVGKDVVSAVSSFSQSDNPCLQIDLNMSDVGISSAVDAAQNCGFVFCGWLPGFSRSDVLRMQRMDVEQTDLNPGLQNPTAQSIAGHCRDELNAMTNQSHRRGSA